MKFNTIRTDVLGGLTAGVVALPLALAFGVQSGLGAVAGLYGAIMLGFFASMLGGTRTQISGPTGPMTVISALVVSTAVVKYGGLEQAIPMILTTFLLAGVFQIFFGFARFGQAVRYIPYPVISGFMSGIGVIIILLQIFPLLGHSSPKKVFDIFLVINEPLSNANLYSVALTILTISIIYFTPVITKKIPSSLLALVIGLFMSMWLDLSVPVIGDIPSGLPELKLSSFFAFQWGKIDYIIIPALTLAALGAIDSLLTSVVVDNMTKTKHDSNRELMGQGVGNIVAALFGGLPGAGATMRTVVNVKAGGVGRLSGMIHSLFLLAVLVGFGTYAAKIPNAVLAGILITVGISIIDYKGLRHLFHIPRTDAVVMLTVFLLTVFVDLLQAVAAGMILASVLFMKKMSDLAEASSKGAPLRAFQKELPWDDEAVMPPELADSVYIKHLDGPLFFGFVSHFRNMVEVIPNVKVVVIRMKNVPYVDQSGLYAIEDAILFLRSKKIDVYLTGVHGQPSEQFRRIRLIPELIPFDCVFEKFSDCIMHLRKINNV